MRLLKIALSLLAMVLATAGVVGAQSTTGTISGQVVDSQGGVLPGVTVSVESPNLQGLRTTVTSGNGDYVLPALPPGTYTASFDLQGFERTQRSVTVAPTQSVPLDVTMGVASLQESVTVSAQTADVLTRTAQVAINVKQDVIAQLPGNRDISAALLLAPNLHPTGPSGGYSIAGSMSFQNLFMVNGVTVNENLRGQPNVLYIEDAIQETTVASAGVSSEYGRFSGGVVNVITKSGGNQFSGSFRETLNNDDWRQLTPFEDTTIANDPAHKDTRLDDVVPTHEYTIGGPALKDKIWFFTAGRVQTQAERRSLTITSIPYDYSRPTARYEGKGTYSVTSAHRVQGNYIKINDSQVNNTFNTALSMDLRSLGTRENPQDLYSINYSGALTSSLLVEALWSRRHLSFVGSGATSTDLIEGTLMTDQARGGLRYWSDTFCGVCTPELRDNENFHAKASYFLSSKGAGSHNMTFGYDNFNDQRSANNHQSGSDYRILGTTTILRGSGDAQVIFPQLLNDGSTRIQWNPIPLESEGSNFRTHALFYNDSWRVNGKVTANLGLRFDKSHGLDQAGNLVVDTTGWSPRLGVVIDPFGDQNWSVTASFAKYVDGIANNIADAASAAGNPQTYQFIYRGPNINPDGNAAALTDTASAISQVFAWYNANGGANLPLNGNPTIPGVTPQVGPDLRPPSVLEYSGGINRQYGSRAAIRVDYVFRDWKDFYVNRTDLSTGKVTNPRGQVFDLTLIGNTNDLTRRYSGATVQGTYRVASRADLGATYTLSRLWGNVDGETVNNGATAAAVLQYPEYKQASWNYPDGDLAADQRHRARFWVNYFVPGVSGLTVSAMQTLESGVPYGASSTSGVDARVIPNPGYQTPLVPTSTTYFYSARDAYHLDGQKRTDFAVNYSHHVGGGASPVELFTQVQVLNLFNNFQLCGCGGTVFQNGGAVTQTNIDQTVLTAVTNPGSYSTFNPFTAAPVQGVNYALGPIFGQALNRSAWTSPQQLRLSFGVRF